LTQQFLTFSSGGAPVKKVFSIAKMIRACGQFALSGAESTCEYSIASDLWDIDADENQIGQVITNMLINADQAMQNGGVIKVACENVLVGEEQDLPLPNGRFIKIDIKDQGSGIPGTDLSNIFDPYFTTNEAGRGLGLTAAYSIIKKHEGHIAVATSTHTGTTFSLYLPAAAVQAEPVATTEEEVECIVGKGKVLVMDDEDAVLQVVETMLNHLGYHVELAVNGEEALAKYRNAQQLRRPFDVVIMDLLVPGGMGGKEAVRKLLAVDPQARVIVSSGYCYDPVMANYKRYGFKGVIAKPYHLAGLSVLLQQVLHH
jgi:CheY-like chemotaxis protein